MNKLIQKAFTLIELLVVIAIIGILSGLIVVSMGGVTSRAAIAKSQVFSSSIRNALMLNLVSEWKFDEGTGTTAYDTWGTYNASLADTWEAGVELPTWVTDEAQCVFGKCLEFSGNAGNVVINNATAFKLSGITQELSISLWAKTDLAESTGHVISKAWNGNGQYNYSLLWFSNNRARVNLLGASGFTADSTNVLNKNVWNHYFLTISSDKKVKLYVNSVLEINGTHTITDWTPSLGDTNRTLTIGNIYPSQDGAQYIFDGKIDDVRMYNAAMPSSQIEEQYYAGLNSLFVNGGITKEEYLSRLNDYAKN